MQKALAGLLELKRVQSSCRAGVLPSVQPCPGAEQPEEPCLCVIVSSLLSESQLCLFPAKLGALNSCAVPRHQCRVVHGPAVDAP